MKPLSSSLAILLLLSSYVYSQDKVGINVSDPSVSLEVSGRIQINEESATPEAGQIRWNTSTADFEGYNGSDWVSFTSGESNSFQGSNGANSLLDIDGNEYKTVVIGTQEWMAENLRTTSFNDGIVIPYIPKTEVWRQLDNQQLSAYAWPNDDIENKYPYGALYNGYAITSTKLCPTGWSVPTETDWITLLSFINVPTGSKLKQTGNLASQDGLFSSSNIDATNSSGFSAIPAGVINDSGVISSIGLVGRYGSQSISGDQMFTVFVSGESSTAFTSTSNSLLEGHSIRCIKN